MTGLPETALIVSLTASATGFLAWLRKRERDRYSKERELTQALNNFASISTSVTQLDDRVDEGFQAVAMELAQIKTLLMLNQQDSYAPDSTIGRRLVR